MVCTIDDFEAALYQVSLEIIENGEMYSDLVDDSYRLSKLAADKFGEVFVEFIFDLYTDYVRLKKRHFPFEQALAAILYLFDAKLSEVGTDGV